MSAVVDASVAAQWVLQQELSKRADALRGEDELIAPSLIAAELGNAIWKAVRWGNVSRAEAGGAQRGATPLRQPRRRGDALRSRPRLLD